MESLPLSDVVDLNVIGSHLIHLAIAFALALPIAWNREREERSLGLRTFPLVAMASAGYVLVARSALPDSSELGRILQGLMTGIGFLGGGAIVKQGASVHGTATAASLWSTAALGAAVALRRYEIALTLTFVNYVCLQWLTRAKSLARGDDEAQAASGD